MALTLSGYGNGQTLGNVCDYTLTMLPDDLHRIRQGRKIDRGIPVRQMTCAFGERLRQDSQAIRGQYDPRVLVDWCNADGYMEPLPKQEYVFAGVCITDGDHIGDRLSVRVYGMANLLNTGKLPIREMEKAYAYTRDTLHTAEPFTARYQPKYATILPEWYVVNAAKRETHMDVVPHWENVLAQDCIYEIGLVLKGADPGGLLTVIVDQRANLDRNNV